MIEDKLKAVIRDIPNFPKEGVVFKDITPILQDPVLCSEIAEAFAREFADLQLDAIVGVESRGFLFGLLLANKLNLPFIPVRKEGKLPADTLKQTYDLEYGSATIEIHQDAFKPGARLLIHDDLLATGGTVVAASQLVQKMGGVVAAFAFVINLNFLKGSERIVPYCDRVFSLASFD